MIRSKNTEPQAQIKKGLQRYRNLTGAFQINPALSYHFLKGRDKRERMILVDDVVTSGATIKEAAKILKKAGAEKVYVFTLAKG